MHGPLFGDGVPLDPLAAKMLSPAEQILPPAPALIPMPLLKNVLFINRTTPKGAFIPMPLLAKRTLSTFACAFGLFDKNPDVFSERSDSRMLTTDPPAAVTPLAQLCTRVR